MTRVTDVFDYQSLLWSAYGGMPAKPDGDDRFITDEQLDYLDGCLDDIPRLIFDLEIHETRQDYFPSRPIPHTDGTESILPFRTSSITARDRLSAATLAVAELIWHRATNGQPCPFQTPQIAAEWLRDNRKLIAQDSDAESFAYRIADAHDRALAGPLERPQERVYLGVCPRCRRNDLYANRGDEHVHCPCGWSSDIDGVIREALDRADDMLLTDTQLVGALVQLDGATVTRDQVNGWARRGRLATHRQTRWARTADGNKIITVRTFRLGDVRDLLIEAERRRAS